MRLLKKSCTAAALLVVSSGVNAVEVRFFADDDDLAYQAQNSATRNIDCTAPATCDVDTGRYRLIGFNNEHSVWVTVEESGSVRYTYNMPREIFHYAVAANAAVATPVSAPEITPTTAPTNAPATTPASTPTTVATTPSTPANSSSGYVPSNSNNPSSLSAPANVVASVYSETSAEVFWDRSASSSNSTISYEVFLDGVSVATTQGASYFFDNLISGTDYSIRIDANAASLSRSSNTVSITTPGAFRLTPVGRPAQDSNTHGFGFWDNMTFEEQQQWPSDCLFAGSQSSTIGNGGTPRLCFSPFRRELIHPNFRYSLPGDNATNHVEVIESVSASRIALLTDITTQFGQSRYELSRFEQSGAFVYTLPILQSIVNPPNSAITRGINLDGKDIRGIRDQQIRGAPLNPNIYVIGEYYEPRGAGNLNDVSGWSNRGTFVQKIDTVKREILSETLFEGRTQESITINDLPKYGVLDR